jgi:hypothetical protein
VEPWRRRRLVDRLEKRLAFLLPVPQILSALLIGELDRLKEREADSSASLERSLSTIIAKIDDLESKTDRALESSVAAIPPEAVLGDAREEVEVVPSVPVMTVDEEPEESVLGPKPESQAVVSVGATGGYGLSPEETRRRELALAGAGGVVVGATLVGLLSTFIG